MIASTCIWTDNPPKEIKLIASIAFVFKEISNILSLLKPPVISKKPFIITLIKSGISKLLLIMLVSIRNTHIVPKIKSSVFIELVMDFLNISPIDALQLILLIAFFKDIFSSS